jgi:hypothetical protein
MRRTRLVLYVGAFAAWTATMIAGAAGGAGTARVAAVAAVAVTLAAAAVGIGHGAVTLLRRWRVDGLPTWWGRR